ncbi:MAG: sensor histidine kinase KdpD [Spirochaetia bacterium]|nr:sensor histidine kinase KdpD [Spirochaetia bacterium]
MEDRPDPDLLLASIQKEEAGQRRGRLKVFFGMAAGVGKTCAMLRAAHRFKEDGRDVVIGYVETHGRAETQELVSGLEAIPRKRMDHRGVAVEDMDVEGILARKPSLVLVDELAHTNPPGFRHPKRYRDVRELIENGIDVYTTVNVQHLESQAEAVERATSVPVRETIPDSILDEADEIELVDLSPEDLLKRLAEGKIYALEKAKLAKGNFFKKQNLDFLRELALDYTAQIVGQGLTNAVSGSVVAVVTDHPGTEHILRRARLLAFHRKAAWFAIYSDTGVRRSVSEQNLLEKHLNLAHELGAEVLLAPDTDPLRAIVNAARRKGASGILIGGIPRKHFWQATLAEQLLRTYGGEFDIHVIAASGQVPERKPRFRWSERSSGWSSYLAAIEIVGIATIVNLAIESRTGYWTLSLVYLLSVLFAGTRLSRGPALLNGALSAALWNYLFIPPKYLLFISKLEDVLMFCVFFVVAIATGTITSRLKASQRALLQREARMAALFEFTRDLSKAVSVTAILEAAAENIQNVFQIDACILTSSTADSFSATRAGTFELNERELGVAAWVLKNRKPAGRFSDTLSGSAGYYQPLVAATGTVGVLALELTERLSLEKKNLLETMASLIALSVERVNLSEGARTAMLARQSEKMYTILLNSLSHELRTPLTTITGAVSSLMDTQAGASIETRNSLLREIRESGAILNRLVGNLLDMSRFEGGHVSLRLSEYDLFEVVSSAMNRLEDRAGHVFVNHIQPNSVLTNLDFTLLEQVFFNLFLNATVHTPPGTTIEVSAAIRHRHTAPEDQIEIVVRDNGPGLTEPERAFEKFYRGPVRSEAGAGLGLSICKAILEAHGGSIVAENQNPGVAFTIKLPVRTV